MKKILSAIATSLALYGCGASSFNTTDFTLPGYRQATHSQSLAAKPSALEGLIAEIRDSGFLKDTDEIAQEIDNNHYGFFATLEPGCGSLVSGGTHLACLHHDRSGNQPDKLMVSTDLFARYTKGRFVSTPEREIQGTILHELFHDFWNNLLSAEEKEQFSMAALDFSTNMLACKDRGEMRTYMVQYGLQRRDLRHVETMLEPSGFYGTSYNDREMFSMIAEQSYVNGMTIPTNMRDVYSRFIQERVLNCNADD